MRLVETRREVRLVHGGHVVSALPRAPGPTHSVFDLLAAAAGACRPRDLAILGFAAGGLVAPLRAIGCDAAVNGVDLSRKGAQLFGRVAKGWCGEVAFEQAEALAWLRGRTGRFDVVIEDLSLQVPGDVTKPPVSLGELPEVVARRAIVAVLNVLPVEGVPTGEVVERMARGFPHAVELRQCDYENRIVIAAHPAITARLIVPQVRAHLARLKSRMAEGLSARTLR